MLGNSLNMKRDCFGQKMENVKFIVSHEFDESITIQNKLNHDFSNYNNFKKNNPYK